MFIFRRIFLNKSLAKKSKPIQSIKDIESIYMAFIHNPSGYKLWLHSVPEIVSKLLRAAY